MKSIDSGVCHRPWSILWLIVQACLLTIEYQVVQYVPSTNISEQFESMYLTILQQISFLLLWSGGHRCMEWILCRVVESSCLPTHHTVPHISLHDPPCHTTMKKYEYFEWMVISLLLPQKFAIQTWFCNCPQYLCLLRIVFECSPRKHDPGKMLVPKSTSLLSTIHIGSIGCGGNDTGRLVTWELTTAYRFSVLEVLRIVHTIYFILQFLYSAW